MSENRTLPSTTAIGSAGIPILSGGVLAALGFALVLLLLPSRAVANVYAYSDTFTLNAANSWQDTSVLITQYNAAALGDPRPLLRIDFVFQATLSGNIGIENLDDQAQTITEVFGATASLQLAGRDPLAITSASPTHNASVSLGAYDGNTNYAGTSGTTYAASATATSTYSSATTFDLNAFTGTGTVTMTASTPAVTALNNVVLTAEALKLPPSWVLNGQNVTGTLWVYYHTPEPGALALLCLALAAGTCRRPRRQD